MPEAIQHPAGFPVYRLRDIEAALTPERFAAFTRWLDGQTGAIGEDGELLVYPDDYERWASGQPENALTWD